VSRRIVLLTVAVTSLVVLAFLVPLLFLVRDVAEAREMSQANAEAQTVAAAVGLGGDGLDVVLQQVNGGSGRQTTVFLSDRVVGAPAPRDAQVERIAASRRAGSAAVPGGRAVFAPVVLPGQPAAVVRTFVPDSALSRGVGQAWTALALLGVVLLLAAAGLAALLGRSMVRPLLSVAGTADALRGGDLSARAVPADPPEVRRIADALNGLAERITDLLQAEREAAADLSHRLRTPLTALRLDAEGLRHAEEAERVLGAVDSLERMVSHVIIQARRPGGRRADMAADAAAVVRERVAFWSALAEEQERPLGGEVPDRPVPVPVGAEELAAAVDALLGNVFAHTPVGAGFTVSVSAEPVPVLVVADTGPGMADPALLDRGRSGGASTGLGLDIVRRTAEAAGGRLDLAAASPSGLRAVVWLGPPPDGGTG
jgi:signal transduction histidine kinase